MAVRAPGIDEISEIAREIGSIRTLRICESLHLTILVSHIYLSVVRIDHRSLEVHIPGLLVHSVNLGHIIISLLYLANQLAVHIVEIQMHIAVAVAWHEDIFLAHDAVLHHLLLHKLRHALLDEHLAGTCKRIDRIESHIVLMAVHRIDNQTVAVW